MGLRRTWRNIRKYLKSAPDAAIQETNVIAVDDTAQPAQDEVVDETVPETPAVSTEGEAQRALIAALRDQVAMQQDVILEQSRRIDQIEAEKALPVEAPVEATVAVPVEEPAAEPSVALEEHLARLAEIEAQLNAEKLEKEGARKKISELQFRLQLSRSELDRVKGQVEFIRNLMLQQMRL